MNNVLRGIISTMKIIATPFLNRKARRFILRLRHEQHRKIKKAAAQSGETMSRFVYRSVMQKPMLCLMSTMKFKFGIARCQWGAGCKLRMTGQHLAEP